VQRLFRADVPITERFLRGDVNRLSFADCDPESHKDLLRLWSAGLIVAVEAEIRINAPLEVFIALLERAIDDGIDDITDLLNQKLFDEIERMGNGETVTETTVRAMVRPGTAENELVCNIEGS
jgi:hypothetical protein